MKKINLLYLTLFLIFISCGGSDNENETTTENQPEAVLSPVKANLVFPENNEECKEGIIINDTQSTVNFEWNDSENTDSYEVNYKNLNTNYASKTTSSSNSVQITLTRGVPYEWYVISKANGTNETATSEIWKFYNQGPGIENYAPFPADVVFPKRGANLESTNTVTLEWSGSDIDDDIISYKILFDTEKNPLIELGTGSDTFMEAPVSSGQTYYWQVITTDSQENSSNSEIFSFRINS